MVGAMYDMRSFPWSLDEAREALCANERQMCPFNVSFPEYLEALQSNGQAQCTTVWTKGTVAYRCRTCQVNESRFAIGYFFPLFSSLYFFFCRYILRISLIMFTIHHMNFKIR